ncbi:MAG TPA: hypothetical protein VGD64_09950 [Acidisarcina sp.]
MQTISAIPAVSQRFRFCLMDQIVIVLAWGRLAPAFVALLLGLAFPLKSLAVESGEVAYTGGSLTTVPLEVTGKFDTSLPTAIIFQFRANGHATEIKIPYGNITGFNYHTEVAHHLGVLPAIAVGLVKRRERKHLISISFSDDANVAQTAIFEVAKHDPPSLVAILRARAPQACGRNLQACTTYRFNPTN